jgi:hypothetical protein
MVETVSEIEIGSIFSSSEFSAIYNSFDQYPDWCQPPLEDPTPAVSRRMHSSSASKPGKGS